MDPFLGIRDQIPAAHRYTYLNSAATSPLPDYVRAAVTQSMERRAWMGEMFFDDACARADTVRQAVAGHLGVSPDGIAFMKNTGEGINHIARSLDIKQGSNVVISGFEFPTNEMPWLSLKGVEVRKATADDDGIGCTPDAFAEVIDEETAVVAVSWVTFNTGYRMDVEAIAKLAHDHGAVMLVDGIQAMGTLRPPSMRHVDVFATGGHKWLMAPLGVGILYVRPSLAMGTLPDHVGWWSLADTNDYDDPLAPLAGSARRFEIGNLAFDLIDGFGAAVRNLPPMAQVEDRIRSLTERLMEALGPLGRVATPSEWGKRGGIVRLERPDAAGLHAHLQENDVLASVRTGALRFSPHFWNTDEDIDRAVSILRAAVSS